MLARGGLARAREVADALALSPAGGAEVNAIVQAVPDATWRLEHRRLAPTLADARRRSSSWHVCHRAVIHSVWMSATDRKWEHNEPGQRL